MWIKAQDGRLYNSDSFSSIGIKEEVDFERRSDKFGVAMVKPTGKPSKWSIQGIGSVPIVLGIFTTFEIAEVALAEISSTFGAINMNQSSDVK